MIFAVISEFNPFHNGHRWLLSRIPKGEEDYTVCIMSGSFVQRGEPAAYDKWSRAAAAVQGGADLVLELPLPYVLSDGERFAAKGVELAAAMGLPFTMVFGTESADVEGLARLAAVSEEDLPVKPFLEQGLSYGDARQRALEQVLPQESALLRSPNNLLACGYIRACLVRGAGYLGIQRQTPHDGTPVGDIASASYIRNHRETFARYCPFPQSGVLDRAAAERGMLSILKTKTADQLRETANISEGLENRILGALAEAEGLYPLYDAVKTKRYSHAKLRRAISAAVLGVPAGMPAKAVPYLRPLAFGERGRELLRLLKDTALLPLCSSGRACEAVDAAVFGVERLATDLRNCWCESPLRGGADYRNGAVYSKNVE